jgi:putative acetyltransferase
MYNFTISEAKKDRMPEVAKAFRESFRHTYPDFPELHSSLEDKNYFSNIFEKDTIYIAEDSLGKLVGFIAFNADFIDHLYLLPEVQRKGLGTDLIKIAFNYSDCLRLWTFQQNINARSFYTRLGFVALKETDGEENEEKQPDILFEWKR